MVPKPIQRARRLIKKYGYKNPDEIDLIKLLYAENLALKYETTDAYQGKIVFNKHTGIITLSHNLENEYQKRYVIAHEMGHFFNDKLGVMSDEFGGKDKLENCRGGIRNKRRVQSVEVVHEFKRDRYHDFIDTHVKRFEELKREKEANQFAVELLMGRRWFWEEVRNKEPEIRMLKDVACKFKVSLTAAALRFAELYKGAMAVVLSIDKRIEWMACNKYFVYDKLERNEPVPLNTRVHEIFEQLMPNKYVMKQRINRIGYKQFLKEQNDYKATLEETVTVDSSDLFEGTEGYLNEIDFAMRSYNSVLTILYP